MLLLLSCISMHTDYSLLTPCRFVGYVWYDRQGFNEKREGKSPEWLVFSPISLDEYYQ